MSFQQPEALMSERLESEQAVPADSEPHTSDFSAFATDSEMIADFITEAREHLASIEEKLLQGEEDSPGLESINAVFRAIHTIKGLAGFLELEAIQNSAHEVETLLDHVRSRRIVISSSLVDTLLKGVDYVRTQVDDLQIHLTGGPPPPATVNMDFMLRIRNGCNSAAGSQCSNQRTAAQPPVEQEAVPHSSDLSIRIETSQLDDLLDMVGELVIVQTVVGHDPHITASRSPQLIGNLALLSRITAEIQRITISMRMVPIGNQFQKTARVVRALSRQQHKQIEMIISGKEIELDKTIAEALAAPLLHLVRNSIDHGIETAEARVLTGKDPVAHIRLAAYHQSKQIVIEIADDGRGLDRDHILAKAVERGLVQPGVQLSDAEIFQLIFEPGLSTAEKVTGISGRGVGMDVVRRHMQRLRGRIDIQSEAGIGTAFFLRLG